MNSNPPPEAKFAIEDFSPVLDFLESNGLGDRYALVGGMAVGAWEEHYFPNEMGFLRRDMDMRADEKVAEAMAAAFNVNFERNEFPNGCVMRCLMIPRENKTELKVDLQETVPGLEGTHHSSQGIVARLKHGKPGDISVLDPLSLFISKLAIFVESPDAAYDSDEVHMSILARVIPFYLRDVSESYRTRLLTRNPAIACRRLEYELLTHKDKIPQKLRPLEPGIREACDNCCEEIDRGVEGMYYNSDAVSYL